MICGSQSVIAYFEVFEEEQLARLQIDDPVDWVFFLPAYARALGKSEVDYYDLIADLEAEALTLYPRFKEMTPDDDSFNDPDNPPDPPNYND